MKLHPYLAAAAVLLALVGCRPGAAEFTEAEAPKDLILDRASAGIGVRFAPGSSRMVAADATHLRAMAASGKIVGSDRVTVAAGGSTALAAARVHAVAAMLLPYGIVAEQRPGTAGGRDQAVIDTGRYMVTLPACPNWSGPSAVDFTNAHNSNFGCATAVNFGRMVWSPADIAEGRPVGLADGQVAASAVNRYLNDKVQLPTATNVGPIAASSSQAPGGAGGNAGSTP